jgi:hypothetical protein
MAYKNNGDEQKTSKHFCNSRINTTIAPLDGSFLPLYLSNTTCRGSHAFCFDSRSFYSSQLFVCSILHHIPYICLKAPPGCFMLYVAAPITYKCIITAVEGQI